MYIAIRCYWWYNVNCWERMMTRLEFVKIITASQRGDRKAFFALYEEYFGRLSTTAFRVVRDADAAYESAMDVIL